MKTKNVFAGIVFGMMALSGAVRPALAAEGQEGKGGDSVEVLYIKAQREAVGTIGSIGESDIPKLPFAKEYIQWFHSRPIRLFKQAVAGMRLEFQERACMDPEGPRPTCYVDEPNGWGRMVVSRELNRATTPEQALALVFHEAGHAMDTHAEHVFLSGLGVELASFDPRAMKTFARVGKFSSALPPELPSFEWAEKIACNAATRRAEQAALNACFDEGNRNCHVYEIEILDKSSRWVFFHGDYKASCKVRASAVNN